MYTKCAAFRVAFIITTPLLHARQQFHVIWAHAHTFDRIVCGINSKALRIQNRTFSLLLFGWGEGGRRVLFGVRREVDDTSELCIVKNCAYWRREYWSLILKVSVSMRPLGNSCGYRMRRICVMPVHAFYTCHVLMTDNVDDGPSVSCRSHISYIYMYVLYYNAVDHIRVCMRNSKFETAAIFDANCMTVFHTDTISHY